MNPFEEHIVQTSRRAFLGHSMMGVGSIALTSLLHGTARHAAAATPAMEKPWRGIVNPPHFMPRVKRVIHLYMAGGPSHLETYDYKPKLAEMNGQPMPESFTKGQQIAQLQGAKLVCFGPQHKFKKFGQSGQEICEVFENLGNAAADEMCIIRSMYTDQINHDPAHTLMNTGSGITGRPSMGSWLLYGLGSDCHDLPGYIVMVSTGKGGQMQPIAARQWSAGFLPSRFQGVHFRSAGDAVLYLGSPPGINTRRQRDSISAIQQLDSIRNEALADPEIATRVSQYEMAFKMQASVPELLDLRDEPKHILDMYGTQGSDGSFGANCLLARRLAERGVRFIQLYHRDWDHHQAVHNNIKILAGEVDRAVGALMTDLKQRGMLEDTLVIYGGEFGRTPMGQGDGRDHHIKGFSMWMAGAGVKGGTSYGATDELGYAAQENPVHVRDFHATLLRLFGIDHMKLTYKFQGLDFRLTGVEEAHVVKPILA